jgi:hypothetical protein
MPEKDFLEKYPLYRKLHTPFYGELATLAKVAIHMDCEVCGSPQTFLMANQYLEGQASADEDVYGATCHLRYVCSACRRGTRHFYVTFGPAGEWVTKIGQSPPWSISLSRPLERALGTSSDVYRKGLISESQGYGIGAFAYYRRVVEESIDQLLDDIESLVPGPERARYNEALAKTKETKVADEKIQLVKDLLPLILRPEGMNPLGVLHDALSGGLHAGTDDECLTLAAEVRSVLDFLVEQVAAAKSASKSFTEGMRKLLDKKGGKPG